MRPLSKKLKTIVLLFIIAFAFFLRFHKLNDVPSGVYVDEAVIGYNAFSLLQTGKDEFGKRYPVFLRSYGAYSSPLYVYATAFPIFLFNLSNISIRLVSVLSGTLSVLLFYLFLKELDLFKKEGFYLGAAFLFAISPWSIFFSRGAYEANFALFILLLSILFLLKSKTNYFNLVFSFALLSLATYAYQSVRLTAILLIPLYVFYFQKSISINKALKRKELWVSATIFIIIQLPQIALFNTPAFSSRAAGLFYLDQINGQAIKLQPTIPYPLSVMVSFIREFLANYVSYFSPTNLFYKGEHC